MAKKEGSKGEVILYNAPDGNVSIDVTLEKDTVWLTPPQMSNLFGKARPTIIEHIRNIYDEEELDKDSTCRKFRQVKTEGKRSISRELE
jgi:hypothetical protein